MANFFLCFIIFIYIEEEIDEGAFISMDFEFLGNFIKKLGPRQTFWNIFNARKEFYSYVEVEQPVDDEVR